MHSRTNSTLLPLCLILAGALLALDRFAIIQIAHAWKFWPVILIVAGMKELYLWAVTENRR